MRNVLFFVAMMLVFCRAWAFDENRDTITKGKYTVVFVNKDPGFSAVTRQRLIDTYFDVYPKEAARLNARALRLVNFVIDPAYDGVAATDAGIVTFNPVWFQK